MLRSETWGDPVRMRKALAGLKSYQQAARPPRPAAAPIIARIGRVSLRSYGMIGRPVLFVPSLINGTEILDLTSENSMLRGLVARGGNPVLLDWGTPDPSEHNLNISGHVERYVLPALEAVGPDAALAEHTARHDR